MEGREPKFIGLARAAEALGVSHRVLLNWVTAGSVPAYRMNEAGKFLVILTEVEAAILRRTAQAKVPPLSRERVDEIMANSRARLAAARSSTHRPDRKTQKKVTPLLERVNGVTVH